MATRRERVVLELEDNFSSPMARAAAATALLDRNLGSLSGSAVESSRSTQAVARDVDKMGNSTRRAGPDIDKFSGRLRLIADAVAILGPGLAPIGAVGVPAIAGLAAQMGAAALAAGTAVLAFQGVGDTLKAVNDASLEPSAENLEKARIAMGNLSPQARDFVRELQAMRPAFMELRNSAAAGLFPGLTESLDEMVTVLPQVERILFSVGKAAGDFAADSAESLAGPRWGEFLEFLETDIPPAITSLGRTVGNLAHGLAEMWMAFDPLNDDFSSWMVRASRSFDQWAQGLSKTEGFRDFVAYIRESGPQVAEAMASVGRAVLDVVEAAAPMGGPVLEALSAVARVISAIADSGAGPAIMASVTALALLNRGMSAFDAIKGSALFAGLGDSAADAGRKMSGMQRATLGLGAALAGLAIVDAVQGGLEDHAIGVEAMTSSLLDLETAGSRLPANLDGLANSIDRLTNPNAAEAFQDKVSNVLGGIGNEEEYDRAVAQIEALDAALTQMVQQGDVGQAKDLIGNLGLNEQQLSDLMQLLPGYRDALAGVKNENRQTADSFRQAASAAQLFKEAVDRAFARLDKRAALRAARDAVRNFRDVLKDAPKDLRRGTAAYDEVEGALDEIARTSLEAAGHLKGMDRVQYLRQARAAFIDAARKMGLTKEAARQLATQLGLTGRITANPKVVLQGAETVRSALADVSSWLNSLDGKTATTWVTTRHVNTGGMGPQANADGGTILGPRQPYGDKVLAFLAPGEEVISNRHGQADRHRDLLKAINANRHADGGTVSHRWHGPPATVSTSSSRVVERVVERMPGQVTLSIPGMGNLVAQVADSRIDADHQFRRRLDDRD